VYECERGNVYVLRKAKPESLSELVVESLKKSLSSLRPADRVVEVSAVRCHLVAQELGRQFPVQYFGAMAVEITINDLATDCVDGDALADGLALIFVSQGETLGVAPELLELDDFAVLARYDAESTPLPAERRLLLEQLEAFHAEVWQRLS